MGKRYTLVGYKTDSKNNVYCQIIDDDMEAEYMFSDICNMVEEDFPTLSMPTVDKIVYAILNELATDENIVDDLQDLIIDYARPYLKHNEGPLKPPCCN